MKKLTCKAERNSVWNHYDYRVYDGDMLVANGASSSLDWVKNDAGGYHTKERFDELYPDGWEVEFDF